MDLVELFKHLDSENRWKNDFSMLHFDAYDIASRLHTGSAKSEHNRNKNRYVDVLPFDETRVTLKSGIGNDYINASHVTPPFVDLPFICSQGPMMNTSMDFWRMVWDEKCSIVVMLNRIIENNRLKCHPYWPTGETDEDGDTDDVFTSVDFNVHLRSKEDFHFYAISELNLIKNETNENRTIYHLHYWDWPDFGVPESPTKFLDFLKTARTYYQDSKGPPIVHCSAGIGRTGTLLLVDTILTIIEQKRTINIDLYSVLLFMRQHRLGLVQTPDQLRFCFLAIIEGLKDFDTSNFTNERIVAELDIDLDSSEGSIEYMESEESDVSADEDLHNEEDIEDDDVMVIKENDIDVDHEDSSQEDGVISPSSIDFLPPDGVESPVETPEQTESISPLSDTHLLKESDLSPQLEEEDILDTTETPSKEEEAEEEVSECRKRKAKTANIVSEMKERLKAHDSTVSERAYMWNNFGKPLLFGSAAAVGLSILVYMIR